MYEASLGGSSWSSAVLSVECTDIFYVASFLTSTLAALQLRGQRLDRTWAALSLGVLGLGLLRLTQAGTWVDSYFAPVLKTTVAYEHRRTVQIAGIIVFITVCIITLKRASAAASDQTTRAAVTAFFCLISLAGIRASSLHWTDVLLSWRIGPITLSRTLQIASLLAMSIAAAIEIAKRRGAPRSASGTPCCATDNK